jgi:hypothetical protein
MAVTSLRAIAATLTLAASRQRAAAHRRPFNTGVEKSLPCDLEKSRNPKVIAARTV